MTGSTEKIENLLSRLPYTDSLPSFSVLHPEYTPQDVSLSITPANVLRALHHAREARDLAVSYRNFNVGAAVFALKTIPASTQIITGANIKPEKESTINVHAEQLAIKRARQAGFTAISIIAVVGETQNDQQSGHEMCTLHPCGLCRESLKNSPLINNDLTLIATALPDLRTIELSTITKLGDYHEAHQFDVITRLDIPDLGLLKPAATGAPIRLIDDDKTMDEDRAWHSLIDDHLFPLRIAA